MRLLFLGDISVPNHANFQVTGKELFETPGLTLANLEGPIIDHHKASLYGNRQYDAVVNTEHVLSVLQCFKVKAVWLANNHMFDLPIGPKPTVDFLGKAGISTFGAGTNIQEAQMPFVYQDGHKKIIVYAFGWDVIGCRYARGKKEGVNPMVPAHLFTTIRELRKVDSQSLAIFIMHWNYELELYPQPAHRQLAHDLVNEGVDAIVGLHPHVVQGAELVSGKPIIYSLGNWFFPPRRLGRIFLEFPKVTCRQLALEINNLGRETVDVRFHWYHFDAQREAITFQATEGWDGCIVNKLTPFVGMSHKQYSIWFKRNRTRRKGLPVYTTYRSTYRNKMKDCWVKARHTIIRMLVRAGLKGKLG